MRSLSLSQEFFLCSVGDKGKYSSFDMEKGVCLVAAGLLELLTDDILALEGKKVTIRCELPADKSYLNSLYGFIQKKQPVKVETIVEHYSFSFSDKYITGLTDDVGNALVQAGGVKKETGGLFGGKMLYIPDGGKRDHVIQKIRAELLEDGELTEDIIALTALLNKSGDLSRYFSAYEKKDLKKRLKEIKYSTENQVVTKMMEYIETLFVMIVIAAT